MPRAIRYSTFCLNQNLRHLAIVEIWAHENYENTQIAIASLQTEIWTYENEAGMLHTLPRPSVQQT
jgi:hypothetical protein